MRESSYRYFAEMKTISYINNFTIISARVVYENTEDVYFVVPKCAPSLLKTNS